MGSNIKFTSLGSSDPDAPLCNLLDIDGFRLLIDCGWSYAFDVSSLDPIKRVIDTVDAVLISHPALSHIGALPYLVGKCGLKAPIYSTVPVRKMGEMLMYDLYLAKKAISDFDAFDLNDVDAAFAFSQWEHVRFFQHVKLGGKGEGITLIPFHAGRFVGGSIWKISKEGEDIVYAVDYCHRKERHLNESAIMQPEHFHRPALMVASALSALSPAINGGRRDTMFLEVVIATLRGDGNVLIPIDSSGRVLELALFLDEFWARERMVYPLVLLSDMAPTMVDFAKQQLEWMSDQVGKSFEAKRTNPFAFRFIKVINSMEQLAHMPQGPKVVLASSPSLECGYSRRLFLDWAGDAKNTICFVQRADEGTLADALQKHVVGPEPMKLHLDRAQRVPLQGEELESFLRQRRLAEKKGPEEGPDDSDDDDMQEAGKELEVVISPRNGRAPLSRSSSGGGTPRSALTPVLRTSSTAIGGGALVTVPSVGALASNSMLPEVLLDGFKPPEGAAHPMFPDEDAALVEEWDDYGVVVKMEDFCMLPTNSWLAPKAGAGAGAAGAPDASATAMEEDTDGRAEAQEDEPQPEPPTKVVTTPVEIEVLAAVRYFDFDARPDGRIAKKVLQDIAPRQLVLVQGTNKAKMELETHCKRELADFHTKVFVPGPLEMLDASLPPSYHLCLSDDLHARAQMKQMKNYALAHVDSVIAPPEPHETSLMTLKPPRVGAGAGEGIFIADSEDGIKLSDIKKALADAGIESIFQAGMIVCGGVTISKGQGDKAHLVVEGVLGEDFYRIRDALYGNYSVC